jgi:DNA end-binding protein Ku
MHPIWIGYLNFGLVSIPIKLFSAVKEKEMEFHLFHKKDLGKIRFARICEKDEAEISWEDVIKGYEYKKNKFVFLDESDFQKVNLHKTNSIDVLDFVNEKEIDTLLYEKPYYLAPSKNEKPYQLLQDGLRETKKVAIARFILHGKEHLAVLKPYNNILALIQIRYADELKSFSFIEIKKREKSKKELNIAIKFIEELTEKFNPKEYKDTYTIDLKKLILKKSKGQKIKPFGKRPTSSKEKDITFLLEKSIKSNKVKRKKIA